jgi:hypothetical protein
MHALNLARYRFHLRVTEPLHLPEYAGSALRGAFGHAFKQLTCVTKARECSGCPLIATCPYSQVFSPQAAQQKLSGLQIQAQIPVPYVLEAPLTGAKHYARDEVFYFDMVLIGDALQHLSLIILAWRRALLQGLGKGDGKAELIQVEHRVNNDTRVIYHENTPLIAEHKAIITAPIFDAPQNVCLHFITPLRLNQKDTIIGRREFTGAIFLRHLIRRVTTQLQTQQPELFPREEIVKLNQLADAVTSEHNLHWQDWARYSSRQKQKMQLGGLVGHCHLHQVPAELLPFIYFGQWLHVGKQTSFGLGGYRWETEELALATAQLNVG